MNYIIRIEHFIKYFAHRNVILENRVLSRNVFLIFQGWMFMEESTIIYFDINFCQASMCLQSSRLMKKIVKHKQIRLRLMQTNYMISYLKVIIYLIILLIVWD